MTWNSFSPALSKRKQTLKNSIKHKYTNTHTENQFITCIFHLRVCVCREYERDYDANGNGCGPQPFPFANDSSPMARYPGLSPIQRAIGGKTGATYGIGVMFGSTKASDGALVVQRLVSGSSAEKSGAVAVGDRLLQVDGVDVIRKPVSYINMMFLGQQGTRVKMILQRPAISAGGRSKTVVVEISHSINFADEMAFQLFEKKKSRY